MVCQLNTTCLIIFWILIAWPENHSSEAETFSNYTGPPSIHITEDMLGNKHPDNFTVVDISGRGDSITGIDDDAFALLPNLEKIILNNNALTNHGMSDHAFRNLTNLWYLDLSNNSRITKITQSAWTDYLKPQLTHFILQHSRLNHIDVVSKIAGSYNHLLYLDLTGVSYTHASDYHYELNNVNSGTVIETLILHLWDENSKLEILNNAFDGYNNLKDLSLSLKYVINSPSVEDSIAMLIPKLPSSLEYLDLGGNDITAINFIMRHDMVNLRYLSLRDNQFSSLPLLSQTMYENLLEIDLAKAVNTSSFTVGYIYIFESLQVLNLHDNGLDDGAISLVLQFVQSNLLQLDLSSNWYITQFPDLSRYVTLGS